MSAGTHFEKEAKGNSEMAHWAMKSTVSLSYSIVLKPYVTELDNESITI